MNKYSIPSQFISGFENIIKLTDDQVVLFSDVFKQQPPGESPKFIFEQSKEFLKPLTEQDIYDMISAMYSIADIFETAKRDISTFTSNFSESYLTSNPRASKEDQIVLKNHLSILLKGYDSVRLSSKGRDIITSNKNNYNKARVITDIRVVFDENIKEDNKVAVVVHNLKFEYSQRAKKKEFFISLDLSDLRDLKSVIDRAIQKDEIIRESKHSLEFIDIK